MTMTNCISKQLQDEPIRICEQSLRFLEANVWKDNLTYIRA